MTMLKNKRASSSSSSLGVRSPQQPQPRRTTSLFIVAPLCCVSVVIMIQYLVFYCVWTNRQLELDRYEHLPITLRGTSSTSNNRQGTNALVPRYSDGTIMSLEERLEYLEQKLNAHLNFGAADPFIGSSITSHCDTISNLQEFGCRPGWEGFDEDEDDGDCEGYYDHYICLDHLPPPNTKANPKDASTILPNNCLVYDFGIRAQPQFGAVMARVFGCEVHAFDPSPVSLKWWNSAEAALLRDLPNYHFHPYGAGGTDGNITLYEYNWDQVSMMRYPSRILDCSKQAKPDENHCEEVDGAVPQKQFSLPVKTLKSIRHELGHQKRDITILKLDVEGSEYSFLEQALDSHGGCLDFVQQLTLEWHHYPNDVRYGQGSSPPINTISTLLSRCGLKQFWIDSQGGWPSDLYAYHKMGMHDMRYNLASYQNVKTTTKTMTGS